MSSFVYGRYTGTEERAAAWGGRPVVEVESADGGAANDAQGKPVTLNFAGVVGDKVLALFPAEALALYTMVADRTEDTGEVINLPLGAWFWVVIVAAPIIYIAGRLSAGHYLNLARVMRDNRYKPQKKIKYSLGEILRVLIPAVAIASWLLGGVTDMAKDASLPDWGILDWTSSGVIGMQGWGIILFAIATACAWITDRIGFRIAGDA